MTIRLEYTYYICFLHYYSYSSNSVPQLRTLTLYSYFIISFSNQRFRLIAPMQTVVAVLSKILVIFFWFETQLSSIFLHWDYIDIRLSLTHPYGICVCIAVWFLWKNKIRKWNPWGLYFHMALKWTELRVVFSQHIGVATPHRHHKIAGSFLRDACESGFVVTSNDNGNINGALLPLPSNGHY